MSLNIFISDYDLSRAWDDSTQAVKEYNLVLQMILGGSTQTEVVEILTTNSVAYADTDGDGILDSSDEYPRDKFNGSGPTGILMSHDFNDAANTQINVTSDNGDLTPSDCI